MVMSSDRQLNIVHSVPCAFAGTLRTNGQESSPAVLSLRRERRVHSPNSRKHCGARLIQRPYVYMLLPYTAS